jgi:regulator of sigma E protease
VRGKAIDPNKENFIHLMGFAFLILLMLIVTYKDLIRINIL